MKPIQDEQALLPCPFCGGEPELKTEHSIGILWDYWVECQGCYVKNNPWVDNPGGAVKEWNTRSLPALIAAAKGMGYAVVPLEPTLKMRDVGGDYLYEIGNSPAGDGNYSTANNIYRAMISAAQEGHTNETN